MQIALIRKDFNETRGGAERFTAGLARGLAGRGHDVCVFAGAGSAQALPGVTVERVFHLRQPSFLKNLSFQRAVRAALEGKTFDIVNGLSQVYPQDVYRAGDGLHAHWLRVQTPNALLRRIQQQLPRHRVILAIEREIFRPANYRMIVVNSALVRDQVERCYGVPPERICLIYNGVERMRFNPERARSLRAAAREQLGLKRDTLALLFAAHNFERKGLAVMLQCAARVKAAGLRIHVIVAGRGRRGRYRRLLAQLGLAHNVRFCGPVDCMESFYAACDLLLHPARYEPFSNVCLEAMACACPVITTARNGASEIIEHGRSGFVIDCAHDVRTMAACILDTGHAALARIGQAAAQTAAGFTIERTVEETLAVYTRVLKERRA